MAFHHRHSLMHPKEKKNDGLVEKRRKFPSHVVEQKTSRVRSECSSTIKNLFSGILARECVDFGYGLQYEVLPPLN